MGALDDLAVGSKGGFKPSGLKAGPMTFKYDDKNPELENLNIQEKKLQIQKSKKDLQKTDIETGKIPAAQLGYYTMAKQSLNDYAILKDELKKGEITIDDIRKAYFKAPGDNPSKVNTILKSGTDAWLRIQTGAQANPSEIQREMDKYQPRPWDSDKTINYKLDSLFNGRLSEYVKSLEENAGKKPSPVAVSKQSTAQKTIKLPSGKTMVIGE